MSRIVANDPLNGTDPDGKRCDGCINSVALRRDGFSEQGIKDFQAKNAYQQKHGTIGILRGGAKQLASAADSAQSMAPGSLLLGMAKDALGVPTMSETVDGLVGSAVNETQQMGETIGRGMVIAGEVYAGGRTLASKSGAVEGAVSSTGRAVGQKLFGRVKPNGSGTKGILNSNSKLRVGVGWNAKKGKEVFRVSIGKGKATKHFDLFDF